MKTLLENLNEFLRLLRTMQLADMVDIALVTFLVYQGIQLIRSSSTARIAKAVVLLLLLSWVTDLRGGMEGVWKGKTLLCAGLYFLGATIGAMVTSTGLGRRKPMELLQIKE